jgi:transglutaminase-like putative cysteine protease
MRTAEGRRWDWTAAGLLFVLLQVAAARLVTTDWAPFLYLAEGLAGLGSILGLALGASQFGRRSIFWLAAAYTIVVVPWRLAGAFQAELLLARLSAEGQTVLISLGQFFGRQDVDDPFLFVATASLGFWLISLVSSYWLIRNGRVLPALVLGGAAIIIVQAYADYQPHGSWWLAVFVLVAVLLGGRVHYLNSEGDWARRRIFINEESWPNILGSLLITAASVILIAWILPTSGRGLHTAAETWRSIGDPIRERLSNAFVSLTGPYGKPADNFYGTSLPLGRDAALGDEIVLRVQVLRNPDAGIRFYWRGRVYDSYEGGLWTSLAGSSLDFRSDQRAIAIPEWRNSLEGQFRLTSEFSTQSLLYGPATLVWADRAATVAAIPVTAGVYDSVSWQSKVSMAAGTTYDVHSVLVSPTIEELRAAGTDYPVWITQRDLEVPAGLRDRLRAIAETVVAGRDNPYDKVASLTSYLRSEIAYSASVPAAPGGQDPTLWVLTSYKKGFCNYYASAEVLMLRSIGIPARLAVGFAHGEMQGDTHVVYRRDAHAWPEVFFPGYGWLEFEPTANQDPLVRRSSTSRAGGVAGNPPLSFRQAGEEGAFPDLGGTSVQPGPIGFAEMPFGRTLLLIIPLLTAAVLVAVLHALNPWRSLPGYMAKVFAGSGSPAPAWAERLQRWNGATPIERAFACVNWSLSLLGKPPPMAATPAERADALAFLMPAASSRIRTLAQELERGLYGQGEPDLGLARRSAVIILLRSIWQRVQTVGGRTVES